MIPGSCARVSIVRAPAVIADLIKSRIGDDYRGLYRPNQIIHADPSMPGGVLDGVGSSTLLPTWLNRGGRSVRYLSTNEKRFIVQCFFIAGSPCFNTVRQPPWGHVYSYFRSLISPHATAFRSGNPRYSDKPPTILNVPSSWSSKCI